MAKKHLLMGLIITLLLFQGCIQETETTDSGKNNSSVKPAGYDKTTVLSKITNNVNSTFILFDDVMSSTSSELSDTGLKGQETRSILVKALNETPYALEYSTVDSDGILTTIEPSQYTPLEGTDISGQEHVKKLKETGKPVLGGTFHAIEGFDAVAIHYPIRSKSGGAFQGELSLLIKPENLIGGAIVPAIKDEAVEAWAMDTNGNILYDADSGEVGRNLFTDSLYQPYPELLSLGRRIIAENSGSGEYQFMAHDTGLLVKKHAQWATVGLYGTEWRIIVAQVSSGSSVTQTTAASAAARGPASDSIIMHKLNSSQVLPELLAGNIDYSLTPLLPEDAGKIRDNPDYVLYYATPQVNGLVFNPAPAPEGGLNPFAIREVRFAMQFLVDRQRVVDEAYNGFALPLYLNINSQHPTYAVVKDAVDSYGFKYDKEKAFGIIDKALTSAGAEKDGGVWAYKGRPIKLRLYTSASYPDFVKTADIVSSELREAGFDVETVYMKRGDKNPVYESDPALVEWNVATTAWIYYSASRYEYVSLPSIDNREGWWNYENNETKKLDDRLSSGNYSSRKEWEDIVSEYAKLSLDDSPGMWIANSQTSFAARKEVRGLINDTYIGLRSYANARNAYVPGKGTLSIGEDYTYEPDQSWNPVVVSDISYMDILNTMHDPVVWSDVKTLEYKPYRWGYVIETRGPSGKMNVPEDAFVWDNETDRWVQVGSGVNATTKVTYDLSKYLGTKWHDGSTITWADVLYFTASVWDASLDESKHGLFPDFWVDDFKALKGLRMIDGNRMEVYSDKWSFDDEELLTYSKLFQRSAPWELYAAMDKAVYAEKAYVYSEDYRPENSTTQPLNLVNATHAQAILGVLDIIAYPEITSQVTAGGKTYATEKDLSDRRKALHDWYAKHGHLIVSDGPYYLEKYDFSDDSIELKAFRDPDYPFTAG